MNHIHRGSSSRTFRTALLMGALCFCLLPQSMPGQSRLSLESQATDWLMQDAPPNPPMRAWLDGVSMMLKEKSSTIDATVRITTSVLPSGLVQVKASVGPNIFLWQVDYPKRKYYSMNKFTRDFMDLIAKGKPLR